MVRDGSGGCQSKSSPVFGGFRGRRRPKVSAPANGAGIPRGRAQWPRLQHLSAVRPQRCGMRGGGSPGSGGTWPGGVDRMTRDGCPRWRRTPEGNQADTEANQADENDVSHGCPSRDMPARLTTQACRTASQCQGQNFPVSHRVYWGTTCRDGSLSDTVRGSYMIVHHFSGSGTKASQPSPIHNQGGAREESPARQSDSAIAHGRPPRS
jgi:hypothetical protein